MENTGHNREAILCPICETNDFSIFLEPTNSINDPSLLYGAASGLRGTQTLVKCKQCGFIYENPRFSASAIISGYESSNEAGHDSQYPMRVNSFLRTLKKLKNLIPLPGSKVLDIGTAGGAFLDSGNAYGYDTYGLEPSKYLVEKGKNRGLKIEQGTIANNPFEPGTFDMVCLWDVIEHLVDPKRDLELIKPLLKPNGILLINYPDIGTLQAKLAGKAFWWLLSVHLHHFDRNSVREICMRTGFEVFHFRKYWQILEFGYLEQMAVHLKIPLTKTITDLTPNFIKKIPIPYYASQTTALARIK